MTKKERALKVCELLKIDYPDAVCQLNAETPFSPCCNASFGSMHRCKG